MSEVDDAVAVLRAGGLAVIPTDTVYGLAADGASEPAARALYAAKGRSEVRPTALLFATVDEVDDRVPELPPRAKAAVRALLPGPLTLIVPNPARRFAWLNADHPDALGLRVPALAGVGGDVLAALRVLVATSANLPGGADPRRVEEVPDEIRATVATVLDGGELPGTPSTVIDLTAVRPRILREGAVRSEEALARLDRAFTDF